MIGRIYIIKNYVNNLLYVGSTTRNLEARFKQHKHDINKYPNFKLYKAMQEFQHNNFYIILIEELDIETIQDLRKIKGQYIKLIKPTLNKNIAGRSMKEYKEDNYNTIKNIKKYQKHIMKIIKNILKNI